MLVIFIIVTILGIILINILYESYKKNIYIWFPSYLRQCLRKKPRINFNEPLHIVFCFVDHFEPRWNKADYDKEVKRINIWIKEYPKLAKRHRDSDQRAPRHTFFYPLEKYRSEHLEKLAKLCKDGFGEVEIQFHHNNDTAECLRRKIEDYKLTFKKHNLVFKDEDNNIRYGFIHGNWALDNSRKDGRWCGVNNELQILKETGCYADFTLPSAPSDTQTRKINSIYYATDNIFKPKSHDTGVDVETGKKSSGDLMIIQGPLVLDFKHRKWGVFPRIENGKIDSDNPPNKERVDLWIKQHIHIKGQPNWIFVKVYTHGCQEKNFPVLFDGPMDEMFNYLECKYNDGLNYKLYYVTAREMYNIIKAIEDGKLKDKDTEIYRDYLVKLVK